MVVASRSRARPGSSRLSSLLSPSSPARLITAAPGDADPATTTPGNAGSSFSGNPCLSLPPSLPPFRPSLRPSLSRFSLYLSLRTATLDPSFRVPPLPNPFCSAPPSLYLHLSLFSLSLYLSLRTATPDPIFSAPPIPTPCCAAPLLSISFSLCLPPSSLSASLSPLSLSLFPPGDAGSSFSRLITAATVRSAPLFLYPALPLSRLSLCLSSLSLILSLVCLSSLSLILCTCVLHWLVASLFVYFFGFLLFIHVWIRL